MSHVPEPAALDGSSHEPTLDLTSCHPPIAGRERPRPRRNFDHRHIAGSSGRVEDQKRSRESGYAVLLRCHRHFTVADAWGQRGGKIGVSQASRKCYGPTRSLIDASRAVALVWCFGWLSQVSSQAPFERIDSPNGAKRGHLAPKSLMTKVALF